MLPKHTKPLKKDEPRLILPLATRVGESEVDIVKKLSKAEKNEVIKWCLEDLEIIDRKAKKRAKLPQFKDKKGKEDLKLRVARFKERRIKILKALKVKI